MKVRPYAAAAVLRGVKFTERRYQSFIALQDKLHANLARNRTLVAIGTHDLSKIKGPFTYEAPPPETIKFIPLNQTTEMNGKQLMDFYEVHTRSNIVAHCRCRMTGILESICISFEMLQGILSFTIRIDRFSRFHRLSTAISPKSRLIHKTSSLNVLPRTRRNWMLSSISWFPCSQSTAPNLLRMVPPKAINLDKYRACDNSL